MNNSDTYDKVNAAVLEALDKGVVPWRKPWSGGLSGMPRNYRGTAYRGINVWLLIAQSMVKGYESNVWLTFKQAADLGGTVRKGEKGTKVILWRPIPKTENGEPVLNAKTGKQENVWLLRDYTVFNVEQCDGLPVNATAEAPKVIDPIAEAEEILAAYTDCPPITFDGGGRAYYVPGTDSIHLPVKASFESAEGFYSTLFHEVSHSTGHASRLDRDWDKANLSFGCEDYAREELVAEFANAYLCGIAGLPAAQTEQSAAYIASWKRAIENDPTILVKSASLAQKAADYVLGKTWDAEATTDVAVAA
jgi:antirestriction protein ArdC